MRRVFLRVLKIGLLDFWRNRWLSLAAIILMAMTIFTISIFVLLNLSIQQTAQTLQEKIDISVFFKDSATDAQITDLQHIVTSRDDVKSVEYISREEALARFREKSKFRTAVLQLLDQGYGTKLPRSLSIKAIDPAHLDAIATFVKQPPYDTTIERLSYEENKTLIDKYIATTSFVKKAGLVLSVLFTVIAILVIYNTVMLIIFMRKSEIEIMQLVGATAWYIKSPFILEGILYGLFGTLVTTIVLVTSMQAIAPKITSYIDSPNFDFSQFFFSHLIYIVGIELLVGTVIGGLCSYLAVRRYLK